MGQRLRGQPSWGPSGRRGRIVPPAPRGEVGLSTRVHGIDDAILLLVRLASDEEHGLLVSVVEEGVADAGAGRERGEVTGLHPQELAVDRGVDLAGDDEGELLLARLGVGPGGAGPGQEAHEVETDLAEAGGAADGAGGRHLLVAVGVAVPGLGDVGWRDDEGRSARHGPASFAPPPRAIRWGSEVRRTERQCRPSRTGPGCPPPGEGVPQDRADGGLFEARLASRGEPLDRPTSSETSVWPESFGGKGFSRGRGSLTDRCLRDLVWSESFGGGVLPGRGSRTERRLPSDVSETSSSDFIRPWAPSAPASRPIWGLRPVSRLRPDGFQPTAPRGPPRWSAG